MDTAEERGVNKGKITEVWAKEASRWRLWRGGEVHSAGTKITGPDRLESSVCFIALDPAKQRRCILQVEVSEICANGMHTDHGVMGRIDRSIIARPLAEGDPVRAGQRDQNFQRLAFCNMNDNNQSDGEQASKDVG